MDYPFEQRNYGPLVFIAILSIALALLGVTLLDIPFTRHAETSHAGQEINASFLASHISNNRCKKLEIWQCPDGTVRILCKVSDNTWGGLILGITNSGDYTVITGYPGRESYWKNNVFRDNCTYTGDGFLP